MKSVVENEFGRQQVFVNEVEQEKELISSKTDLEKRQAARVVFENLE